MSDTLVNTLNLPSPTPLTTSAVMGMYKSAPKTPANSPVSPQGPINLSALGSTNAGKLAGPPKGIYGPAIPQKTPPQGGFGIG
jgi:hypothetical protein